MNITLSPKIQRIIQEKVDRGDYAQPDEVVNEAFRPPDDRDRKYQRIRELIDIGDRAAHEGKTRLWSPELREELRRKADEAIARGG
jgi:putative addiction module CopG family antidote